MSVVVAAAVAADEMRVEELGVRLVGRHIFKDGQPMQLTAYKDEYEVARLLTRQRARDLAEAAVPGGTDLTFKLHPPMLRALGRSSKIGFTGSAQAAFRRASRGGFGT